LESDSDSDSDVVHEEAPDTDGYYYYDSLEAPDTDGYCYYDSLESSMELSTIRLTFLRGEEWRIQKVHLDSDFLSARLLRRLTCLTHLVLVVRRPSQVRKLSLLGESANTLVSLVIRSDLCGVHVPSEIARCRKLEYLQVTALEWTRFAKEIGSLPHLKDLCGWVNRNTGRCDDHDWKALQREWASYIFSVRAILDRPGRLVSVLVDVVVSYL
jgi:hypothetical protein